jgi:uroporphyrinogen decarboxylase
MDILDDLIEIGYTSLHPLQESAGMDPRTIKDKYGDKIVVYGSLDVIDGLLAYDGEELDEYITKRFEIYAPGGGFIFNGGHFIQPDIPPMRLVRAYTLVNKLARQYGTLG